METGAGWDGCWGGFGGGVELVLGLPTLALMLRTLTAGLLALTFADDCELKYASSRALPETTAGQRIAESKVFFAH